MMSFHGPDFIKHHAKPGVTRTRDTERLLSDTITCMFDLNSRLKSGKLRKTKNIYKIKKIKGTKNRKIAKLNQYGIEL